MRLETRRIHWAQARTIRQAQPIKQPGRDRWRSAAVAFAVLVAVVGTQAAVTVPSVKAAAKPRAVVIVGPAGSSTSHFLDDGHTIADQAEAAGMDVTRIFHPHATWQRVLNNIQGANLVIYMGHGNGWPSPYAPFQERTKDGLGLDGYDGASSRSVTYYGANQIRDHVRLAPKAIVALIHLCYASGNGEPGMAIPGWSVASQRVDNFSAGFLDANAKSVFAFGWMQDWNFPGALMHTNKTMEQLFETPYHGNPNGWIGWRDRYIDSNRSPGLRMHLDPHPTYGFYRSLVGGFGMTAGDWRGEASSGGGGDSGGTTTSAGPSITSLSVVSTDGGATTNVNTASTSYGTLPSFHPNGDGLQDRIIVSQTLSAAAYLDVKVTNSSGTVVRKFTVWAKQGTSTSGWSGRSGSREYVPEGVYTLTYRPRDTSGNVGTSRAFKVVVLNAVAFNSATGELFARDGDALAATAAVNAALRQPATVSVKLLDQSGTTLKTIEPSTALGTGPNSVTWDGHSSDGSYVKDGWYRLVVNSKSSFGSYREERPIWLGAFRVDASTMTPARGGSETFWVYSTEPLSAAPKLDITQPALATYTVGLTKVDTGKYKVALTLKSGGTSGDMGLVVNGVDSNGNAQSYETSLPLR